MTKDQGCAVCGEPWKLGHRCNPTSLTSEAVDFHCGKCGAETTIAPDPPAKAVCENCCDDHEYRYERGERAHICIHCGKPAPEDYLDVD